MALSRQKLKMFQEPQCLIETDKDGHLAIRKETLDELMKINMSLNVVAITGLYRTGKSYLMNRLANHTSGFALGNRIQSKTKGIWVFCKIHPTQKDQVLLLLDTEGLGDVEKGNLDHDNKLFMLATLLSNTLVYNLMTAFNQDSVEKLTFITEMSKNLRVSAEDNSDENFDLLMPALVLCMRDFALNLVIDGKEVTEDEYLDHCLKERKNYTKADEKYNRPRECIKKYFTIRKAFTFDRPASRKMMQNMDKARDEDLWPEFITDTAKFTSYIYERPPKMLPNKRPVTGSMLAELLKVYVNAMKAGNVLCIDDAFTVMSKAENERRATAAIEKFRGELRKITLPVPNKRILLSKCIEYQTSILSSLNSELLFDDHHRIERSTKAEMEQLYKKFEEENSKHLYRKCFAVLTELYDEEVKDKVNSKKYMVSGGYEMYKGDMTRLLENYTKQFAQENADSLERDRARISFMSSKTSEANDIMSYELTLYEQERQELKRQREELLRSRQDRELELQRILFEFQNEVQGVLVRFNERMSVYAEAQRHREGEFEQLISITDRQIEQITKTVRDLFVKETQNQIEIEK